MTHTSWPPKRSVRRAACTMPMDATPTVLVPDVKMTKETFGESAIAVSAMLVASSDCAHAGQAQLLRERLLGDRARLSRPHLARRGVLARLCTTPVLAGYEVVARGEKLRVFEVEAPHL